MMNHKVFISSAPFRLMTITNEHSGPQKHGEPKQGLEYNYLKGFEWNGACSVLHRWLCGACSCLSLQRGPAATLLRDSPSHAKDGSAQEEIVYGGEASPNTACSCMLHTYCEFQRSCLHKQHLPTLNKGRRTSE